MKTNNLLRISVAALAISTASAAQAQAPAVPAAPTPTIWRFMGIPQGIQKIRDVSLNRRGNFPGLERKPPLKRIADPANLESPNPAIKAAAEIKQAEDMKAQKIKAIKFLAKMGCGCYDKEGKITDALIAAMDDCTPDVRLAAIEAIESAATGECCQKCGSTSCCSEKVTKRLSEIAYERDDSGCHLEPNADIRAAAAKALCTCCPNRATGPIEEDTEPLPVPTPIVPEGIQGEGNSTVEGIQGEGAAESDSDEDKSEQDDAETAIDAAIETSSSDDTLRLFQAAQTDTTVDAEDDSHGRDDSNGVDFGTVTMIGGMTIQPVTISPVTATEEPLTKSAPIAEPILLSLEDHSQPSQLEKPVAGTVTPVAMPIPSRALHVSQDRQIKPTATPKSKKVEATIVGVDQRTGRVILRSGQPMQAEDSVTVYHRYLTGEQLVAHLLIVSVNGNQAIAQATDAAGLAKIRTGDRAECF